MPPLTEYRVVLVPAAQTSDDGCRDGLVKLTGTPGQGAWEEWGPYPLLGSLHINPDLLGVPRRRTADQTRIMGVTGESRP